MGGSLIRIFTPGWPSFVRVIGAPFQKNEEHFSGTLTYAVILG